MSDRSPRRDFRLLLVGQTTSQLGAQVSAVAIPLLAVLALDASPWQVGVLTASSTVAFAVLGLPAGAWVDRWPRRPVLVASDLMRAVLLASIPIASLLGLLGIGQLIAVSLLAGTARVFFDVAYQSYTPAVLGRRGLLAGNSAMETVRASAQVAGPAAGGWLVAAAGAANAVLVQVAAFTVSAASLAAIRTREPAPGPPGTTTGLRAEIAEGVRYVAGTSALRAIAATGAAGNLAFAIASAVTIVFMVRTLGLSPAAIGVILAVGSVTVIVGAAATPWLARRAGSARIVWLSLAVTGPVGLLTPFAQPGWSTLLLVAGIAAGELGQIGYAITSLSLRQQICPPHLLGRVNATMRFLTMGLFPLGALLGGVLGEVAGVRVTLGLAGSIIVASAVPVYLALRHVRTVDELTP